MIRLIASDIDGTMVPDSSDYIHPGYYDAVRALKKKGITFCACSGRQFHSMQQLLAPVAEDIYFITENGTLVRTKDRILRSWAVDPDYYVTLLQDMRAIEGASAVVSSPKSLMWTAVRTAEYFQYCGTATGIPSKMSRT